MKIITLALAATLSIAFCPPVLAAQHIRDCGLGAKGEVEDALDFLHANVESIMASVGDYTNGEKRRLRRKIDSVNIKCKDHRRVCRDANRGGISRHLFDAAVVICYNNIREVMGNGSFCKLADVIVHEIAHAANVDKDPGHNNGPNTDKVYRTGFAAGALCQSQGLNGPIAYNTND